MYFVCWVQINQFSARVPLKTSKRPSRVKNRSQTKPLRLSFELDQNAWTVKAGPKPQAAVLTCSFVLVQLNLQQRWHGLRLFCLKYVAEFKTFRLRPRVAY